MTHYELSMFLAKAIGITMIVLSIAILKNINLYLIITKKITENPILLYLVGSIDLILGILIVLMHNDPVHNWTVLVTIFGWLLLTRGVIKLAFPKWILSISLKVLKRRKICLQLTSFLFLAYGTILLFFGLGVN